MNDYQLRGKKWTLGKYDARMTPVGKYFSGIFSIDLIYDNDPEGGVHQMAISVCTDIQEQAQAIVDMLNADAATFENEILGDWNARRETERIRKEIATRMVVREKLNKEILTLEGQLAKQYK